MSKSVLDESRLSPASRMESTQWVVTNRMCRWPRVSPAGGELPVDVRRQQPERLHHGRIGVRHVVRVGVDDLDAVTGVGVAEAADSRVDGPQELTHDVRLLRPLRRDVDAGSGLGLNGCAHEQHGGQRQQISGIG